MRFKKTSLHPVLVLLAVALVSVFFVVACGDDEDTAVSEGVGAAEPKYGGTLTMTMVADFGSMDPAFTSSQVDLIITQSLYDNLLMIQPDGTRKPELAASWEFNEDNSSLTFNLRQDVKFRHLEDGVVVTGKEFKAEDVLFTINRIIDPELGSALQPTFESNVEDMVAVDDYTVRFDLVAPNAFFLDAFSLPQVRIIPADVDVERLTLEAFGTGPFLLEEHLPGERTTMVRNDDYWEEGKPYLDEFVILNLHEAATRAEALKSGDVDVIFDLEPQSVADIESHPDTVVLEAASGSWIGLNMMNDRAPFDNKLIRQAFQAATDRESIRQAALLGRGTIAYDHPVSPNETLFASQYAPPGYDPELAKQLLAEAGYPDGIDITLHTSDIGAGMVELAVAFKESAAPAGIRVDVQQHATDVYWSNYSMQTPFNVTWWAGRPNPDLALSIQSLSGAPWNDAAYDNKTLTELVIRARAENPEERKETYAEIQRIMIDDVPRIVPAFKPIFYGVRTNVRGVMPHPLGPLGAIVQDGWLDD